VGIHPKRAPGSLLGGDVFRGCGGDKRGGKERRLGHEATLVRGEFLGTLGLEVVIGSTEDTEVIRETAFSFLSRESKGGSAGNS
jgi:hypothetical protein